MIRTWICLVLLSLPVHPLYADYGKLNTDKQQYAPPAAFLNPAAAPLPENGQDRMVNHASDLIKELKQKFLDQAGRQETDAFGLKKDDLDKAAALDATAAAARVKEAARLHELKALALARNPGIAAARKKVSAEIQSFDQVANLDDSLRQYSAFTPALNNQAGPVKGKENISMSFPPPGITALKGQAVAAQVSILLEQEERTKRQVIRDVTAAFWDLLFTEQSVRVVRETIAAFKRLKDVATVLYKSGRTSFQDVIKVNIKLEELEERLATFKSKRVVIQSRLLELVSLPPDTVMGKAEAMKAPRGLPAVEILFAQAREHRQELKVLRFKIDKVSAMVAMSEAMIEARSSLGFSLAQTDFVNTAGTDADQAAFKENTMAAMKNNSPVRAWYGVNEPWLEQSRQTLQSLKKELMSKENATDRMVRSAWFKTDKTLREYRLYKNRILALARSALDVTTREYEAGSVPFSQAIDSYTYWLKVELLIAEKRSSLGEAFADLENTIGTRIH